MAARSAVAGTLSAIPTAAAATRPCTAEGGCATRGMHSRGRLCHTWHARPRACVRREGLPGRPTRRPGSRRARATEMRRKPAIKRAHVHKPPFAHSNGIVFVSTLRGVRGAQPLAAVRSRSDGYFGLCLPPVPRHVVHRGAAYRGALGPPSGPRVVGGPVRQKAGGKQADNEGGSHRCRLQSGDDMSLGYAHGLIARPARPMREYLRTTPRSPGNSSAP
jgi:hypothetical protein